VPSGAVERLPSGKLAGILTYFQAKVNIKFLLGRPPAALRKFPLYSIPISSNNIVL
jgi:hypothetical protein